jgi:hypothetical protein
MRRFLVVVMLVLGCAGVVLAPAPSAVEPDGAAPSVRPIGSAVLACPELGVTDDSASTLSGLVVPGVGGQGTDTTGEAVPAGGGQAALRVLGAESDLVRLPAPGEPVSLLASDRSQPPILLEASGSWAPAAVAGIASTELDGPGAGLASAACLPARPQWWFVGAGSELGRGSALLVSNPAAEPARFDLALYARSGPVDVLVGTGIDLAPQAHVRLRLDALAPGQDVLAIQVRATVGRVGAALRDVAVPREGSPRGVDFIPAASAPDTALVLGGIPGGAGARDLILVNPGTQFATVAVRLITEEGTTGLAGLPVASVPAGSVISIPLAGALAERPGSLLLTSDVPITGGVRASWGALTRDLSWLSAVPAVRPPNPLAAAAAVPAGTGLATTVTVVAAGAAVTGTLSTITTGTSDESVFGDDGSPGLGGQPSVSNPSEGPLVVTSASSQPTRTRVQVPTGSQRTVLLPGVSGAALAHVWWQSDPGSGPAVLTHLTRAAQGPGATGYSWWPTASAVVGRPVREDVGTLAPVGGRPRGDTTPMEPGDDGDVGVGE